MKVYQKIAREVARRESLENATTVHQKHDDILADIDDQIKKCMDRAPHGSGIDDGVQLLDNSKPNRLVFQCNFHHMDEYGSYSGWTHHEAIITPDLRFDFNVRITGRNYNEIKDLLFVVIHAWLDSVIE